MVKTSVQNEKVGTIKCLEDELETIHNEILSISLWPHIAGILRGKEEKYTYYYYYYYYYYRVLDSNM